VQAADLAEVKLSSKQLKGCSTQRLRMAQRIFGSVYGGEAAADQRSICTGKMIEEVMLRTPSK